MSAEVVDERRRQLLVLWTGPDDAALNTAAQSSLRALSILRSRNCSRHKALMQGCSRILHLSTIDEVDGGTRKVVALALPRGRVASWKSRCIILVLVSRSVSRIGPQMDASDQVGGLGYIILMLLSSPCLRNPCEILSCASEDYSVASVFGHPTRIGQALRVPRQEH
jgi:hypothetical protein